MSDLLGSLVARARGDEPALRPVLAPLFAPDEDFETARSPVQDGEPPAPARRVSLDRGPGGDAPPERAEHRVGSRRGKPTTAAAPPETSGFVSEPGRGLVPAATPAAARLPKHEPEASERRDEPRLPAAALAVAAAAPGVEARAPATVDVAPVERPRADDAAAPPPPRSAAAVVEERRGETAHVETPASHGSPTQAHTREVRDARTTRRAQTQPRAGREDRDETAEPIRITIGRVEVRQPVPPPLPRLPAEPVMPRRSLEDYLAESDRSRR